MRRGSHVVLNGELLPRTSAHLHPDDTGFLCGDGVFETLRLYAGVPFLLDAHLRRLAGSCQAVALALPWSREQVAGWIADLVDHNDLRRGSGRLRLTLSRGVTAEGVPETPTTLVTADPYEPPDARTYTHGVEVETSSQRRHAQPWHRVKSTSYQPNLMLRRQASRATVFEVLQWNDADHLAEGSFTNVFVVDPAGVLRTPLPDDGCLRGVTRDTVVALAASSGLSVREGGVSRAQVASAREMFLTGSLIEVVPVRRLDDRELGDPGPVTQQLLRLYRDTVRTQTGP